MSVPQYLQTNAIEEWFKSRGWTPAPFQRQVWEYFSKGKSGLLHSETGSGKTLAVWLGALQALDLREKGLKVIWLTPLRALAADTLDALNDPLTALEINWRVESRTGDTSSSTKSRQMKAMPDALITTPESLSLMLASGSGRDALGNLRVVIVDEWHELLGTKRGVQTELALARLRQWNPGLVIWGISATLGNLDTAVHALIPESGPDKKGAPVTVQGTTTKEVIVDSLLPAKVGRFPWSGHIGTRMVPDVVNELESAETALIFTNTRAQAEIWHQAILMLKPEWENHLGLHHGSLDLEKRRRIEESLKNGGLKAVVATSSLDLGVDFSPVDRVFQIGSPKGVARLLQRAGRSGHRPGIASRVTFVPTNAMEIIDLAGARRSVRLRQVEDRLSLEKPLDVLVQHLVTVALGTGFKADDLLHEVRQTAAYQNLSEAEWNWSLDFVVRGGQSLAAYPDYHRVEKEGEEYRVTDKRIAMRHRMNIGTITSDSAMVVQYLRGSKLGTVEESFVARLKKGDRFVFGGKALEFVMVKDLTCYVRAASAKPGAVPRWAGGRMPLSTLLAENIRRILGEASEGVMSEPEMVEVAPMLAVQADWSAIPSEDELLIEQVQTSEGHHLFIYPMEGRLVHEGLAVLLAYRLSRSRPLTFTTACNDYGLELLSHEPVDLEAEIANGLLSPQGVGHDIMESLNASEMARRQFREIARISGLVMQSVPGTQKSVRQVQASSGLIFDVFARYDPDNLLLQQSLGEVLARNFEEPRLMGCLERLGKSRLVLKQPAKPTPFAFPILVDRLRETVSSETFESRLTRMLDRLEKEAG